MIKAIIFDCFGVLTTDMWRAFVDGLPPEADVKRARELNHQYDAGLIDLDQFLAQVHEVTGRPLQMVEKLLDNEATKNSLLLDYITKLKMSYKVGLLSNIATDWITTSFLTPAEAKLFDEMIFSYQVGMTKPDLRIFELICQKLGVEPHEAVMIDDIESYCQSARSIGMKAIVYKDFTQFKTELEQILNHR